MIEWFKQMKALHHKLRKAILAQMPPVFVMVIIIIF